MRKFGTIVGILTGHTFNSERSENIIIFFKVVALKLEGYGSRVRKKKSKNSRHNSVNQRMPTADKR